MVPEIVVADKMSAFKSIGSVPNTAIITMDIRPKFKFLLTFKSIANNFENEEKVESKVDAAEVIIMKLMINKITRPKALPTSTAACPVKPCFLAYIPIMLKSIMEKAPKKLAHKKLFRVVFGVVIKARSVKTGS